MQSLHGRSSGAFMYYVPLWLDFRRYRIRMQLKPRLSGLSIFEGSPVAQSVPPTTAAMRIAGTTRQKLPVVTIVAQPSTIPQYTVIIYGGQPPRSHWLESHLCCSAIFATSCSRV